MASAKVAQMYTLNGIVMSHNMCHKVENKSHLRSLHNTSYRKCRLCLVFKEHLLRSSWIFSKKKKYVLCEQSLLITCCHALAPFPPLHLTVKAALRAILPCLHRMMPPCFAHHHSEFTYQHDLEKFTLWPSYTHSSDPPSLKGHISTELFLYH